MDSLPIEILHHIFIQLPFKHRLKCTLVCRYWYNALSRRSLLYEIKINTNKQFQKFENMLRRMPSRRSQVEVLAISCTRSSEMSRTFDKRFFFNMLPNLRVFRYLDHSDNTQVEHHWNQPFELIHPNSKLEKIRDARECELTRQVLIFGSCTRLRQLELDLKCITNPRKEIFIHLKSVPSLKKLALSECDMGIEDCEIIHSHLPALKILELTRIVLIDSKLPDGIAPATSVITSAIIIAKIKDYSNYLDWYIYLAKKYTQMTSFECKQGGMDDMDPNQRIRLYRDGIYPIYKNLGIPLPEFCARNFPIELNPFDAFDAFDFRITKMTLADNQDKFIFEELAVSQRSKYVELLDVTNTAITLPIMLRNFSSLRELRIVSATLVVNLTDYFNAFPPTLTDFYAHLLDANIVELPTHSNHVSYLALYCSTLYPKLAEAISRCFPKLDRLHLKGNIEENITLHLPNNQLSFLTIETNQSDHAYAITEKRWPQTAHFIAKGEDKKFKLVTAQEIQDWAVVSLNYASAKMLCFGNLMFGSC